MHSAFSVLALDPRSLSLILLSDTFSVPDHVLGTVATATASLSHCLSGCLPV